jgi:hypothetical protein
MLKNTLYGEAVLKAEPNDRRVKFYCNLYAKNKENKEMQKKPGKIIVEVQSMRDIRSL